MLDSPSTACNSKAKSLNRAISDLQEQITELAPEKNTLLERLVNNMCSEVNSFSADFAINKIGEERQAQELFEHAQNIEVKKAYLFKEIIKLEKIQIAESIMQIEAISGPSNKYKVVFDSSIINQHIEMDFEEVASLNKLREYSLFGIHKTVPNSPFPYFSYCKELDALCREPDFKFEFSMPYNSDPCRFDRDPICKKPGRPPGKPCVALTMCHHCKVLLPPSSFFVCSKKCKCLQSEPCTFGSPRGFLKKEHFGVQNTAAAYLREDLLPKLYIRLVQLRAGGPRELSQLPESMFLHKV